jgi:two-component system chemotaxis response regulator CheB
MISALTQKGAEITLQAMEYGAIDFICKPQLDIAGTFEEYTNEIVGKIRVAARAKLHSTHSLNAEKMLKIPP